MTNGMTPQQAAHKYLGLEQTDYSEAVRLALDYEDKASPAEFDAYLAELEFASRRHS